MKRLAQFSIPVAFASVLLAATAAAGHIPYQEGGSSGSVTTAQDTGWGGRVGLPEHPTVVTVQDTGWGGREGEPGRPTVGGGTPASAF
ncbi:hypothetical protein GFH48_36470 [Streptomyces fagopyri]|uniref:Uncharacterized protein n=1 Tax=Streptomyces fagopyri TaxID=2662397 RepID=A0A5Q0LLW4_9ACTN|nr:hypothetical protein [Streptomyces fagopyri]QFZ78060.1 hypothetical protein GFH48_36470 [Streptomyces fagopyri]